MYVFCAKVKLLLTEFICLTFDYLLGVVAVVLAQQINCVVTAWWWKMMSGINIDLTDKRLEYDKWICGVVFCFSMSNENWDDSSWGYGNYIVQEIRQHTSAAMVASLNAAE